MESLDYLKVTDIAATKIKEFLSKQGVTEAYVRISAGGGGCGCSGPAYRMAIEPKPQEHDIIGESNGVKFVLNSNETQTLKGAQIDYIDEIDQSGFKIDNPTTTEQSHGGCGCGSGHGAPSAEPSHEAQSAEQSHGGCGCGSAH